MKKKRIGVSLLVVFLFFVFISLASTQSRTEYEQEINDAYSCLDDGIENAPSISLDEAFFSALADVPHDVASSKIDSEKSSNAECWPKSGCRLKETAQALLVKKMQGEDTTAIADWIKSRSGAIQGLTWYLQITINNNLPAECILSYGGTDYNVNIGDDLRFTGNSGGCLDKAKNDYWLKIRNTCIDETFEISCGEDFKTNLLYEKTGDEALYLSININDKSANAWAVEEITALCFKEGNTCDYEGSLWATTALASVGEETSTFAPYLIALGSGENEKYFPSAFIYHILEETSLDNDQYNKILENQRPGGLFRVGRSPYNAYYDTALAMLALGSARGGADAPELIGSTVPGLFNEQSADGCWGTLRDTAFLLFASQWQRPEGSFNGSGDCVGAGEQTDIDSLQCCDGLTELDDKTLLEDGTCESGGVYGTCSDCGDGTCQDWESACTCAVDCADEVEPGSCVGGNWFEGSPDDPINTTEEEGFCHLANTDDWPDGCCVSGFECNGEGGDSICEFKSDVDPGDLLPTNACDGGQWYDENSSEKDTTSQPGYCHLETDTSTWPYGCCPQGYNCEYDVGNESESVCEFAGGGGPGPGPATTCGTANFFCVSDSFACLDAGGEPQWDFECSNYLEACCDVDISEESCFEKGGVLCGFDEDCTGGTLPASDGFNCCTDTCVPRGDDDDDDDDFLECESDNDCLSDEECTNNECFVKDSSGGGLWFWIIFFLILIGLTVLGIIYRDKLRLWYYKMRGKAKISKVKPGPPGVPGPVTRRAPPRFGLGRGAIQPPRRMDGRPGVPAVAAVRQPMRPASRAKSPKEKEMEETMRKLKEMSK